MLHELGEPQLVRLITCACVSSMLARDVTL